MKKIICISLLCLTATFARAGVIPEDYNYVLLPQNTADTQYSAFTAINARGFAVGYGTRNNSVIGFVFNYYTGTVEHVIDDFYPSAINDHNKIIGLDFSSPNFVLKQCTLADGQCELSLVEGAERTYFESTSITNSDIISGNFFVNTPEQKYLIYQFGNLLHSESFTGTLPSFDLLMKGTQMNNTRLFVGARKTPDTAYRPIVKTRDILTGITELALPVPTDFSDTDKMIASSVNSRNEIILQAQRGTDTTEIYSCEFLGDNDGDGVAECADGLNLISTGGELRSNVYPSQIESSNTPVNDKGLMLAPALRYGEALRFYDLNQQDPVAVPITNFSNISVFLYATPLEVENNGAVLVKAAQTVIFVPMENQQLVVDTSYASEPIVLSPEGGRLQGFVDRIENNANETRQFYVWRVLVSPQGVPFPVGRSSSINLDPGEVYEYTRTRTSLRPYDSDGEYRYVFYVKDKNTGEVMSDEIRIVKQP